MRQRSVPTASSQRKNLRCTQLACQPAVSLHHQPYPRACTGRAHHPSAGHPPSIPIQRQYLTRFAPIVAHMFLGDKDRIAAHAYGNRRQSLLHGCEYLYLVTVGDEARTGRGNQCRCLIRAAYLAIDDGSARHAVCISMLPRSYVTANVTVRQSRRQRKRSSSCQCQLSRITALSRIPDSRRLASR